MKLDHWFYYNLPGETLVETSKAHGTSSNFNKPQTYVNSTRSFITCNSNLHMSKTSCTTCRAIRRENGSDREWLEQRKMSDEESETKDLQATATNETRSNFYFATQGRKLHLKVLLGEVENAVRS
jgi:hypothetical protein